MPGREELASQNLAVFCALEATCPRLEVARTLWDPAESWLQGLAKQIKKGVPFVAKEIGIQALF